MRLYGTLQELSSLTIRLDSGKTVQVVAAEPTVDATVTIPDVVDGADTFVVADTAQTLLNKSLTAPQITQVNLQDSVRIDVPVAAFTTQAEPGSLKFNSGTKKLTIGDGTATRVLVDDGALDDGLSSGQRPLIRNKRLTDSGIENTSFTGGSIGSDSSPTAIDYVNKIGLSDIPNVNANHVLISDANNELFSEQKLDRSRGGTGADLSNVTFPGDGAEGRIILDAADLTSLKVARAAPSIATSVLTPSSDKEVIQRIATAANFNEIANPEDGRYYILMNASATDITIGNETGTEANQIVTGTGAAFTFKAGTSIAAVYDGGSTKWRLSGGAGGAGGGTADVISQVAHGFVVGDALYLSGSTYTKAIATAANTAEVVGVVSKVVSSDTFELTTSGEITGLSGLTPGGVYFLSSATAGLLTLTEPSVVGYVSLPIGVASSASSLYVAPKRGVVVGAANARTTIAVSNNAATNVVDVTSYNSLKLEGELNVTRSSGGNHRAYYTVEAAKNGAGVWQVSASYTGDDVLYTTLPAWDVSANQLQLTMPNVTNFSSASLTYALGAPAVGASLPLSIDSSSINIVESAPLSNRNVLINGNFDIWQRGTSQTSDGYGSDDRWVNEHAGSTKTHSQQAFALGQTEVPGNPKYFSRTVVSSVAGASNYVVKYTRIESAATLAGQTATLSFWAKADAPKNMAVEFGQAFGSGGTPSPRITALDVTTIALTTSWKKYTVTVDIPSIAGKTLGTNNNDYLEIVYWFEAGSNFDNRTNSLGQQSGTFDIAQVQLEAGSKATAFEKRPYGTELHLCQRYFQIVQKLPGSGSTLYGPIAAAYQATRIFFSFPLLQTMRRHPTITSYNLIYIRNATLSQSINPLAFFVYASTEHMVSVEVTPDTNFTPGSIYLFSMAVNGHIHYDAEL
jgi:hypothetical protein